MEQSGKKTICLNMIVKNESHIIIETLKNLCSYIDFSYWVISDTGSTDNTKELIINFFKDKGVPGELVEHEWVDFAYNRTKALECAFNKSDYLLVFDADDSIVGDFKLPANYDCDRYTLRFGTDFSYLRPLLFTNRKRWKFRGVLHEFLENIDPVLGSKTIEGNYYLISGRSGNRSKNPNKYIDDATVLKNAFYKEFESDYSMACRYAFYCAQSYKDAGSKYENDAIEWYKKCLTLTMWEQEKYHSCLCIGNLYMNQKDYNNALKYWYKTVEYDGERIDGIVYAQNYLRNDGQHLLVNALYHRFKNYSNSLQNKLFLFQNLYNCQLEYNNMISSYYVNDKESGYQCFKEIILKTKNNYLYFKSAISNFKYYDSFFKADTEENILELFYAYDNQIHILDKNVNANVNANDKNDNIDSELITLWNTLFDRARPLLTKPIINSNVISLLDKINRIELNTQVMITFTTCKRVDLFKQTVNSILNHWTDFNKIDYWFCVDDNSSDTDREEMNKMYPWINYYMKTVEEKGHRQSMNIIWNKLNEVKPHYWIHMEDDFLFYHKTNYIERAINGLTNFGQSQSHNVKQILFNRNYTEIVDHYKVKGHVKISETNDDIVLHNYLTDNNFNYLNCHYWPHYSFRPSLIETKVILELGNYDSLNQFFEMDYAILWEKAGYKSGFFNRITNRHIGRLTSDMNTKVVKNAYDLNNENQFSSSSSEDKSEKCEAEKTDIRPIKIINLERRQDRRTNTIKQLSDAGFEPNDYEFVKATDGSTLEPTQELKELFQGNDFGSRKGVIGCALSHYRLWQQLVNNSRDAYYLIMEDDFILCPDFKSRFKELSKTGAFVNNDVLFLGYHMFSYDRQKHFNLYNDLSKNETKVVPLDKHLYIGGYFMYSINKNGAEKLLDYIEQNGIKHGIDYLNKIIPNLHSYECQPQLIFSEWNENGRKIDSDIQNIYDKLDFLNIKDKNNNIDKEKIVKIKMLCNWTSSQNLCKEWSNMCDCDVESVYKWKNYQLVWTDIKEEIDYYVIVNSPPKDAYYDPKHTIVFQMEPWVYDLSKSWGVKTWAEWAEPDCNKFLAVRGCKTNCHNNAFWQLELKLNDLQNSNLFEKTNNVTISSIMSSKYFDEGHIARIDFLKFLESKGDIELDIYGQDNIHNFKNYRSKLEMKNKSNGIKGYKYYFMMENNFEKNYITEKLWEPILCETLVFYYGCPNVTDYIDPGAFVLLDINNFENSYQIIKQAIKEDWWSQRIEIIRKEKHKILDELAFFPTIDKIISQHTENQ